MSICIITSLVLAVGFVLAAIIKKKELPESISSLVYLFSKGYQWVWTVWIWLVAITLSVPMIEALPAVAEVAGFFLFVSLGFVGAMPLVYKEQNLWHNIFGIAAGVISQVCVAIINPWWLMVWVLMLSALWMKSKAVFISEVVCAVGGYGCLMVQF